MSRLYVLGGRQRKRLLKLEEEQRLYDTALILEVDGESGEARVCLEYQSPLDVRASAESSVLFKAGALVGDSLYTCTSTEALIFQVPQVQQIGYVSLPCFNDLHHVTPSRDGNLLAANTGLDMVAKFTPQGKVLSEWNVLGADPWAGFSRDIDYRKVESTKPHASHPNFVFDLNDDIWVTRFEQRDAVCLTNPPARINIGVQRPHDGVVFGDHVYFTTVDGRIVIVGGRSLAIERVVDLNHLSEDSAVLLGWCRGILPLDDQKIWAGFTRVRKTQFQENILWIKHRFRERQKPTHIALYDLAQSRRLREIDLEPYGMNVVFGIYR